MNTVFTSSADPSIGSMSASSNRYNGMIRISLVKRIRNMLFSLFDYMSMTAPHLRVVHTVMSAWRIVQIFGASLCCAYTDFWVPESTLNSTINILSIAFHIFPTSIRAAAGVYFLYGYTIFNVLLFAVIITSAYFYTTRAELPHWLVTTIYFVFSTLCYLLQPIFGMFLGRLIGNFFKYPDEYIVPVHIISAIVSILSLIIFLIIYSKCYSVTVTFRPDSLITVYPINQTFLLIIGFVTSLFPAIACRVDVLPRFILSILNSLVYGVSFFLLFYKGGFVNMLHTKLYAASTLSGMILMLVVSIQDFIGQTGSEILLFIVIAIWIVVFVIISFIFNRINMSYMRILDLIEEDEEMFSNLIKNDLKFASVAISGIRLAHPICVNYTFFKMAIKAFPKSVTVWIVYAKFVAIYPEETQQLEFIFHGIVQNKIKGSFAKHIMQQITAVIKQREQNLIPELKKKLNNIGKHASACKAKIRYIWELVLQGNISELENVISRAHSSVQRTMTEYQELLGKFPNNRFVARAYTRYLRDVVADHQKCQEWAQKCAQLQRGIQVVPDNAYELGILAFPALPKETSKMISNFNNNNCTEDTLTQEVDVEEEHLAADQELRLSLKDNINSLHIPAYIHVRCLHICSLVLLFIVPLIAIIIATPIYMDDVSSVIPHLYTLTKMRAVLFQGMFVLVHYINENINWSYPKDHKNAGKHFLPFPTYDDFFSSRVTEEEICGPAWGGSFDSKVQLDFISETISNLLSSIIPMKTYKIGNERMNEVRTVLFDAVQPYTHIHDSIYLENWTNMTDNPNDFYTEETHELASLTTIMSNYMTNFKDAAELKEVPWDSYNKYYMGSTLNNLENATGFVTDAVYLMLDYITSLNNSLQFIIMIARIVLIIAIILWYLFVSIYSMR